MPDIPESFYAYLKKQLKDNALCWQEAARLYNCEDLLSKLEASENGWDWKCAGYNVQENS